jgi:hypothetical protein
MNQLNKRILHLEIPDRMKRLPISDEGYPISLEMSTARPTSAAPILRSS